MYVYISGSLSSEFLHADSLNVTDISNVSAKFEWTHVATNNIHHIKFKVYIHVLLYMYIQMYMLIYICLYVLQLACIGIQTFTRNGDLMEERSLLKHESWSTSHGHETYTASELLPNCHYTCHLMSVAGRDRQSATELAPQVTFHTAPGSKECAVAVHVLTILGCRVGCSFSLSTDVLASGHAWMH